MNNIENQEWVTEALKFWTNTTSKACGKSRKVIRWNIEVLTAALSGIEKRS
jgi:hypothetical protein